MSSYGYIKVSRKFFVEDPLWKEQRGRTKAEAWLDLIYLAAFRDDERPVAGATVHLKRGELVASYRFLSVRWKWTVKKVRTFIKLLIDHGRIERVGEDQRTQDKAQRATVYLIVNYDFYQGGRTAEGTPRGTAPFAQQGPDRGRPKTGTARGMPGDAATACTKSTYMAKDGEGGKAKGTVGAHSGHEDKAVNAIKKEKEGRGPSDDEWSPPSPNFRQMLLDAKEEAWRMDRTQADYDHDKPCRKTPVRLKEGLEEFWRRRGQSQPCDPGGSPDPPEKPKPSPTPEEVERALRRGPPPGWKDNIPL